MSVEFSRGLEHFVIRQWQEEPRGQPLDVNRTKSLIRLALREPVSRIRLLLTLKDISLVHPNDIEEALCRKIAMGDLVVEQLKPARRSPRSDRHAPSIATRVDAKESHDEVAVPLDWIEIELLNEEGEPVPYEFFELVSSDGEIRYGNLNAHGIVRIDRIPTDFYEVTFPHLSDDEWSR